MTSTRKTLIVAIAALSAALSFSPAFAANGETGLGKCYNHVISSCNATSKHPGSCANSGMNACDAEFKNKSNSSADAQLPPDRLRAPEANGILIGLLLPAVQSAREAAR